MNGTSQSRYPVAEEIANAVTHGVGAVASVAGLVIMLVLALYGDGFRVAGALVFGSSLVILYAASTLYHALPYPRAKHVFKILDHAAIYLLIAGTYTPFAIVTLRRDGGWWMFGILWSIALVGVALEAAWVYRPKWLSVVVFLAMGWTGVAMIHPLTLRLAAPGLWLLMAGGLTYTVGTAFYVMKRWRFTHAVWHLFVLGGSVCHFLTVTLYVLPSRA